LRCPCCSLERSEEQHSSRSYLCIGSGPSGLPFIAMCPIRSMGGIRSTQCTRAGV
jgi:hypothetical protein